MKTSGYIRTLLLPGTPKPRTDSPLNDLRCIRCIGSVWSWYTQDSRVMSTATNPERKSWHQANVALSSLPPPSGSSASGNMVTVVNVIVRFFGNERVVLPDVKLPITYEGLSERLKEIGHSVPNSFDFKPQYNVTVTSGKSSFGSLGGGEISIDEPLIQYYNENFLDTALSVLSMIEANNLEKTQAKIVNNQKIEVGGLVRIGFQRTIRVPDNNKTHALPPDMGPFPIYNTADFANKLPPSVSHKGGICIAMYQREAMWMSFTPMKPCAVKVSVGGINAITGTPRDVSVPGKQDYLALSDDRFQQLWLDGVATAPRVVRQFVAVPLGKGLTLEGQITGQEIEGGIQFDIFPMRSSAVAFKLDSGQQFARYLSIHKSPRQLGLLEGSQICMEDIGKTKRLIQDKGEIDTVNPQLLDQGLHLYAGTDKNPPGFIDLEIRISTGKIINLYGIPTRDTVYNLKCRIQDIEGIPPDQQRLNYVGRKMDEAHSLHDYRIQDQSAVYMTIILRGGGDMTNLGGIGVGGRISQNINKDPHPTTAYDFKSNSRLHVSIINASAFPAMTGLPPPPSPVSPETYIAHKLPWFELYDEHIPTADTSPELGILATKLESVGTLLTNAKSESKDDLAPRCGGCDAEMATMKLVPCGHNLCDDCANTQDNCPTCDKEVVERGRFAAPMRVDEPTSEDGVVAGSQDPRIHKLSLIKGTQNVTTFKSANETVSPLNGSTGWF